MPDPTIPDPSDIIIPSEISDIFDEATDSDLAAVFVPNAVRLVTQNGTILREVQWADANEYGRRMKEAVLATLPDATHNIS